MKRAEIIPYESIILPDLQEAIVSPVLSDDCLAIQANYASTDDFSIFPLGLVACTPKPASEEEVLAAMDTWRQAMINRDRPVLEELYAQDLVCADSSGKRENEVQAIDAVIEG